MQSSYCASVRARAKKKKRWKGKGERRRGEKRREEEERRRGEKRGRGEEEKRIAVAFARWNLLLFLGLKAIKNPSGQMRQLYASFS